MTTPKRKPPLGQTIGGVLFGFDQQVWRNQPPPHELVLHARPVAPVPAAGGELLTIELPREGDPARPTETEDRAMHEPAIHDLAAQPTVGVRVSAPMAEVDVGALVGAHLPGVAGRIPGLGLEIAGPPYVRYFDWGGQTADLELGFPVDRHADALPALDGLAPGEMGASSLPGGTAAVAVHEGPYPDLPVTWQRLRAWIEERRLEPAGAPWESYVDNPDLVAPASLRTLVVRPLKGA